MSEENVTTAAPAARKMVSVNGKDLSNDAKSNYTFLKPKNLTADQVNTIVAAGIFSGRQTYNFEDGTSREDVIIVDAEGNKTSVAQNASLKKQFAKISEGSYIEITYLGSEVMTKGPGKGKTTHKLLVGVDASDLAVGE